MPIKNLIPRQPDPYIKYAGDQELAKFGHLRWLIREINAIPLGTGVQSIVAGNAISVDSTDPYNPIVSAEIPTNVFFQGAYNPQGTSLYPQQADTIGGVPITAGMYWVVSDDGTINGQSVSQGDAVFALVDNASDNADSEWTILAGLFAGTLQDLESVLTVGNDANQLTMVGLSDLVSFTGIPLSLMSDYALYLGVTADTLSITPSVFVEGVQVSIGDQLGAAGPATYILVDNNTGVNTITYVSVGDQTFNAAGNNTALIVGATGIRTDEISEATAAAGVIINGTTAAIFLAKGSTYVKGLISAGDDGIVSLGDKGADVNNTYIDIDDSGLLINLRTDLLQMNGVPTHTGTVDTAATPNLVVVNGLIMSVS